MALATSKLIIMLLLFKSRNLFGDPIKSSYRRLVAQPVEKSGYISHAFAYEDYDLSVDSMTISSYDFSVANIVSVGGESMLKPVVMSSSNVLAFADAFESLHIKSTDDV